ncbi:4'-phosphopantetheinyl transferase family protein [Kordia sp.]|uniref:4'-phosphopantetheinyl transferase family protein n=1 Tax=Kordia sp. TaxID=1965332 RepID=UPI003B5A7325
MNKIFYVHIHQEVHQRLLQTYLHTFPEEIRTKILRFRRWQDAQLSLLGRLLLRYGLKMCQQSHLEDQIEYTAYNKPYFKNSDVRFNISHSGDIVICGISETEEFGIDIEVMDAITIDDFKMQMTDNEWLKIYNASNQQVAFYEYWTQKEAVIKAQGKGMSIALQSFEIQNQMTEIENRQYEVKELFIDTNYKCHIAFPETAVHKEISIQKIDLSPNATFWKALS